MLFKSKCRIHLDEPYENQTVTNSVFVSGWCSYAKKLVSVSGSINNGDIIRGIVGIYRPELKVNGFSLFTTQVEERLALELNFKFEDGSKELFHKEFTVKVDNMLINIEKYPYQIVLHNAGVEGRVLKRENIYGFGPPVETPDQDILDMILHYAGERVLDVGCGIGVYVEALSKAKRIAKGIEVNERYVQRGKSLNREVMLYDGRKIPFEDDSFDTVISFEVLEHIEAWEDTLKEMIRVSKHNILFSVPDIGVLPAMSKHGVVPWHILESTHVNFFTREILAGRLSKIKGISFAITRHAPAIINNETFYTNLRVIIEK